MRRTPMYSFNVVPASTETFSSASPPNVVGDRFSSSNDDRGRFTRFVSPHLGDAYSLAYWITHSRADAEDVVQDACLRAFRAIGSMRDGNARPWLLTIVRNTAYTWLHKNRPKAELRVEDFEEAASAVAIAR